MVEKRTFEGGMNLDLEERLIPPNQYRYALNIRLSDAEESAMGVITNEKGTTLVSFSLPTGINTCIGWFDDINEKRLYYVVHNNEGSNRVLAYDYVRNEVLTVVVDENNYLQLDVEHYITGIEIIQGDTDDFLLFTDDFGEIKCININTGIRSFDNNKKVFKEVWNSILTYNTGDVVSLNRNGAIFYYIAKQDGLVNAIPSSNILPNPEWELAPSGYVYDIISTSPEARRANFTLIARPPKYPPSCEYLTYESVRSNNLRGKFFQFKYKYVMADGRESAWSPISEHYIPLEITDGIVGSQTPENVNNVIRVVIDRDRFPDHVSFQKSVKIAVRTVIDDNSPDDWYVIKTLELNAADGYNFGNIEYIFTNNELRIPIDQSEANQLQSWIPQKAKALALTSENRVVIGNLVEGNNVQLYGENLLYDENVAPEIKIEQNVTAPFTIIGFEKRNGTPTITNLFNMESTGSGTSFRIRNATATAEAITIGREVLLRIKQFKEGDILNLTFNVRIDGGALLNIPTIITVSKQIVVPSTAESLADEIVSSFNRQAYVGSIGGIWYGSHTIEAVKEFQGSEWCVRVFPIVVSNLPIYILGRAIDGISTDDSSNYSSPSLTINSVAQVERTLKQGSIQRFAIAYSDEYGRISNAVTNDLLEIQVPFYGQVITPITAPAKFIEIGTISASIKFNHSAPSWAKTWHLLKSANNNIGRFVQFSLAKMSRPTVVGGQPNPLNNVYFKRGFISDFSANVVVSGFQMDALSGRELLYIPLSSINKTAVGSYADLTGSRINYQFRDGDRIRLCYYKNSSGTIIYSGLDFDSRIAVYNQALDCVGVDVSSVPASYLNGIFAVANEGGFPAPNADAEFLVVMEVYSPTEEQTDNELYREIYTGNVVEDSGFYEHRPRGASAIEPITYFGDVYLKVRAMPNVTVVGSNTLTTAKYSTIRVEESSFYDRIILRSSMLGRPNRTEVPRTTTEILTGSVGEFKRNVTIRYTLPYNPETGFNGIGTALDTSFIDASQNHGSIQRLYGDGQRLLIYQVNKRGYSLAGQNVITGLDGSTNLAQADTPLSKVQYYTQEYGISNDPESFAVSGTNRYFVDINRAVVCREGENGVFPISDYGIKNYMIALSKKALGSDFFSVRGFFDEGSECYFVTFRYSDKIIQTVGAPPVGVNFVTINATGVLVGSKVFGKYGTSTDGDPIGSGTINGIVTSVTPTSFQIHIDSFSGNLGDTIDLEIDVIKAETLSFSERYNAWESFHSFVSDTMGSAGVNFCSWQGGQLYIHNNTANMGRFYGINYDSYFDVVSNAAPDVVKAWLTTDVATNLHIGDSVPLSVPSSATAISDSVMSSGVYTSMGDWSTTLPFKYKEGQLDSAYMRAKAVPASDYVEGRKVRGYWQKTRFKINGNINKVVKFFVAKFNFIPSMYTN